MATRTTTSGRKRTTAALATGLAVTTLAAVAPATGVPALAAPRTAAAPAAAVPGIAATEETGETTFLWAVDATAGTIVKRSGGRLVLRLTGVPGYVTQFADRPAREAFAVSTRAFVDRWDSMFGDDDPNAVLSFVPRDGARSRSIVVTLSKPRLKDGALVFSATRIHRQVDPSPYAAPTGGTPDISTPSRFVSPGLFIDSFSDRSRRLLAEVYLMPTGRVPYGDLPADGRELPLQGNTALFSATFTGTFGPGQTTFPIPSIPPTWPAMTTASGAATQGGWILNDGGIWASEQIPETLLPGQVFFTSAYRYDPSASGGIQTTLGGTVPAGMRAFEFPAVTYQVDTTQYISELRLLRADAGVPNGWFAADGSLLSIGDHQPLFSLVGITYGGDGSTTFALPKVTAPAGYRWVIADIGYYPPWS